MARKHIKESKHATQLAIDTGCTALYVRVSTELQASEGYSLENQQERLQAYCTAQGWIVCPEHIYVDAGVSGKTVDRPQFKAMLQAAQDGTIKRIVAMKLDRMARNVREFLATVDQLKTWHCDLVLVKESFDTSTPHGRFALTMFAAMAELEASTITERLMSGKGQKAKSGGFNGGRIPYAYRYEDHKFVVDPAQAEVVKHIFAQFNAGASLNAIMRNLNESGTPTATGKDTWYLNGVRHILNNGAYAGVGQWDGTENDQGTHPAIISRNDYDQAQDRITKLSRGQRVDLKSE